MAIPLVARTGTIQQSLGAAALAAAKRGQTVTRNGEVRTLQGDTLKHDQADNELRQQMLAALLGMDESSRVEAAYRLRPMMLEQAGKAMNTRDAHREEVREVLLDVMKREGKRGARIAL